MSAFKVLSSRSNCFGHLCLNSTVLSGDNPIHSWVQCWSDLGTMYWHRKATLGRRVVAVVFFWYLHNNGTVLYEPWQSQYNILLHIESQLHVFIREQQ